LLEDPVVQEILMDITDDEKNSFSIIECILKGKTSDEEISDETQIKLNVVRKVLYKLYDAGIASYKRTKDPETKWEVYSWKFDQNKVSEIISKKYDDLSKKIEKSIKYEEENIFFACKSNGHRYKFEDASRNNFVCPECGETLEYIDNSTVIVELLRDKARCISMEKSRKI
jgi:transcription initiation factor TFIIE subunit alpha